MLKQTVLVVDDEEMIRNNLVRILEKDGHDVVTACNGQEALQVFREQHPDLVLLDILMPIMNGFDSPRPPALPAEHLREASRHRAPAA